jgi:predicted deacylase
MLSLLVIIFYIVFQLYILTMCYNMYKKKNYKYLCIYLFSSILFLFGLKQLYNYCEDISIYEYSTGLPGPTILIVSGSHGNESGPSAGLDELVKELNTGKKQLINNGKLIIIPTLNKCGRKLNIRWKPQDILSFNLTNSDINRNYGKKENEEGHCSITKKVQNIVDNEATYILDFHEGYSYNKINPSSMGQTLYPGTVTGSEEIAKYTVEKVNEKMKQKEPQLTDDDIRLYSVVGGWPEIDGSLRKRANLKGKPYVLVEIAGQGGNETLENKKYQTKAIAEAFIDYVTTRN